MHFEELVMTARMSQRAGMREAGLMDSRREEAKHYQTEPRGHLKPAPNKQDPFCKLNPAGQTAQVQ